MSEEPQKIGVNYLEDIDEYIDALFNIEEEGRKLAYARDEKVGGRDFALTERAVWDIEAIDEAARGLADILNVDPNTLNEFTTALEEAAHQLRTEVQACYRDGMKRGECLVSKNAEEAMRAVDEAARKLFGKRCTWLLGEKKLYTLSALYNDFAACVHRLAEAFERASKKVKRIGKCYVREGSSEDAIRACLVWDEVTNGLADEGKYEKEDAELLLGYVRGDEVQLRVGSSPGHLTRINLGTGKLDYYDTDPEVNTVMYKLLTEWAGLKCNIRDDGVSCTGVKSDNIDKVAAALAAATSMDFRLQDPRQYYTMSELMEMERHAILRAIKRYLERAREVVAAKMRTIMS